MLTTISCAEYTFKTDINKVNGGQRTKKLMRAFETVK